MYNPLDKPQQAAVNVAANTVVSAGAGSGKTRVLAERFTRLVLAHHVPATRILTLTFTRKAAAEMFDRIYRSLVTHKTDAFVAEQLRSFSRVTIATLDSFCTQIVRDAAPRFGLTREFTQDNRSHTQLARQTALDFLYRHTDNPILNRLIAVNGFNSIWLDCLAALAEQHTGFGQQNDPQAVVDRQMAILADMLRQQLQSLAHTTIAMCSEKVSGILVDKQRLVTTLALPTLAAAVDDAAEIDTDLLEQIAQTVQQLQAINSRGGGKDDAARLVRASIKEMRERAAHIEDMVRALRSREQMLELQQMVERYRQQLIENKRRQGVLAYQDVLELAVATLIEDEGMWRYHSNRFDHIMIDEFQDTNAKQKQLLYLLARRSDLPPSAPSAPPDAEALTAGKLFFVGDEKQSIYRFRGADVGVFRELVTELPKQGGLNLDLSINYRSQPALVAAFNGIFPNIMADAQQIYEARYQPLTAGRSAANIRSGLSVWRLEQQDADGRAEEPLLNATESTAWHVATFIHQAVTHQSLPVASHHPGEPLRQPRWSDFALLFRSTTKQPVYERMLQRLGVPFTTPESNSPFREAPAGDICALLRLCLDPDDCVAYAMLLRSPLVNLSDQALTAVINSAAPPFDTSSIPLAADDQRRLACAGKFYQQMREHCAHLSASELVDRIWFEGGYRYLLLRSPETDAYREHYDLLFRMAASAPTLVDFVDTLQSAIDGERPDLSQQHIVGDVRNAVHILTIHKSKGLQFPVVIVADAGNMGRRQSGSTPYYYSPDFGLTFNLPDSDSDVLSAKQQNLFYTLAKEEEQQKDLAELKRLLYVALTRAESYAIVAGVQPERNSAPHLLRLVDDALTAMGNPSTDRRSSDETGEPDWLTRRQLPLVATSALLRKSPPVDRQTALAQLPTIPTIDQEIIPTEFSASFLNQRYWSHIKGAQSTPPVGQHLPTLLCDSWLQSDDSRSSFGQLCHWLIEQQITDNSSQLRERTPDEIPSKFYTGLPSNQIVPLLAEANRLATSFLASPLIQELGIVLSTTTSSKTASSVTSELPFLLRRMVANREIIIHGIIDLLVEQDQQSWIIDFKTDRVRHPGEYAMQLALYCLAAAELTGRRPTPLVYYLRDGSLDRPTMPAEIDAPHLYW